MELETLTIAKARAELDAKKYSAEELTRAYLSQIEKVERLNAYLEVFDDALLRAREADTNLSKGNASTLSGIPISIKDNILVHERRASAGSKMLEQYIATYDATVVKKVKEAGAILLGRTNMDEFAMGASTENSAFGVVKNPFDERRVAGGSSGGSAVSVAAFSALASLGSDTGGSVRQPASFCGVVGLKPTYGSISRFGLIALGSSLDQIGPITRTVDDTRMLFNVLRGNDTKDSTSLPDTLYANKESSKPKKVGVMRELFKEGVDEDVLLNFEETLKNLKTRGYEVIDIKLPHASYALSMYYIIMPAEASTNLARFDGIRYGLRVDGANMKEEYERSRSQGFGKEVRRRILLGTHILSSGYYDAYYVKAINARKLLIRDLADAFEKVDVIATPTSPTPAFLIGEKSTPMSMYLSDIFTVAANLTGMPALSIPSGTVTRNGKELPVGFHVTAPYTEEERLFSVGSDVEAIA